MWHGHCGGSGRSDVSIRTSLRARPSSAVRAHVCSPRARRPPTTSMTATTTTTTETAATATKKYSLDGPHNAVVGRSQRRRRRRVNLPFVAVVVVLYTIHVHYYTSTHAHTWTLYYYTCTRVFYCGIYFIDSLCRLNKNNNNREYYS